MSLTGIPSEIHTTTSIPASDASIIASAAKGGGTNIIDTSASVAFFASSTLLKTFILLSTARVPPLPGVTPPTIWVPYSSI